MSKTWGILLLATFVGCSDTPDSRLSESESGVVQEESGDAASGPLLDVAAEDPDSVSNETDSGVADSLSVSDSIVEETSDANGEDDGGAKDATLPPQDLSPPVWPNSASIEVLTTGTSHAVLTWTEASDESGIEAYILFQNGEEVTRLDRFTTVFKVDGLKEKTSYEFRVEAEDTFGNKSVNGPVVSLTLEDVTAPVLPEDLTIEALEVTPTKIKIGWSGTVPIEESLIWRVWLDFQAVEDLDGKTNEFTFESLAPLTAYSIQLSLLDEAGNESPLSAPLVIQTGDDTPPVWPLDSELEATNVTESSMTLTWPKAIDSDSIAGYVVSQDGTQIDSFGAEKTSTEISGLSPWVDYAFEVVAVDPSGLESIGLMRTVKTADNTPPSWSEQFLEFTTDTNAVTLNWSAAGDLGALAGYRVYRDNLFAGQTDALTQTLLVQNVPSEVALNWRVEAFDEAGNETIDGPEGEVTLTDVKGPVWPPSAEVKLFEATTNSAVITWDLATDDGGLASYDIVVDGELHKTVAASVNVTLVTGLTPASQVTVSIFARDLAGNMSSNSISLTFTTGEPGIPTWPIESTLEALSIGPETVTLSWSLPNDDVEVDAFHVYKQAVLVATVLYPETETLIENLMPESTLEFRVEAVGLTGLESTTGPSLSVSTPPLEAPQWSESALLFATADSEESASLSWTGAPSGMTTFHIYVDGEEFEVVDAPATFATLDSLEAVTEYTIRVEAAGPSGLQSNNGPETSVITLDETPPEFPAGATLTVGDIGETSAVLSWTAAVDNVSVGAYRIVDLANAEVLLTVSGDITEAQVTSLLPESQYAMQLQAGDGSGNWTEGGLTTTFQTLETSAIVSVGGVYTALEPFCGSCHFFEFSSQGNFEQTFASNPSVVVPGDPDSSKLIQYLEGTFSGNFTQMPPFESSYEELVTSGEATLPVSAIRDWIEAME